jgi:hypothetical protein
MIGVEAELAVKKSKTAKHLRHYFLWPMAFSIMACMNQSEQSGEFKEAREKLDQVITETFDDSFSDPAFKAVEKAFEAVPENDKDYSRARAYIEQIQKAQRERAPVPASPPKDSADNPPKQDSKESQAKTNGESSIPMKPKPGGQNKKDKDLRSSQKKAYDKVIGDFKKAEKVRKHRLQEAMKEIDILTKKRSDSRE